MAKFSLYRLHEWLADRVKWVQYPRQQYIQARPQRAIFLQRQKLGFLQSLAIFQLGLVAVLISLALLAVGVAFAWMLVKAILTT